MKISSTRARRAIGLVVLGLAVTACGGSDSTDEPGGAAPTTQGSATPAPTTQAPATPAPDANLSGSIAIDGSSTVAPLMKLAAEDFQDANDGVSVTVGTSGTGGGLEKFCNGESDIANASRRIKDEEKEACAAKGIEFAEMVVANDALSVVVNTENDWAKCLTVAQLKTIWEPAAEKKITNWNQVDPSFPDQSLSLFGAGTDSGTFDYFTDSINGDEGVSRTDYNPTEDDNVTVTGVSGDKGALGYFGFSYLLENEGKLAGVAIDNGAGCVEPKAETVQDGTYQPLSRELYVYVAKQAAARPEMKAFLSFFVANQDALAEEALFVGLKDSQKATQADELKALLG